jgi:hypothetical protein
MARLRQRNLCEYQVKRQIPLKDEDGTTYTSWNAVSKIRANIIPAGGRIAAELYGVRLAYMLTAYAESGADLKESDGICVYVLPQLDPDYRVVAIQTWSTHSVVTLEAIRK